MLSRYLKNTKHLALSALLTTFGPVYADKTPSQTDTVMSSSSGEQVIGEWQLAVGLGVGKKQSIIYDQDDRSLHLLPSIKYYGQQLFFDNGTLGYTLLENNHHAVSIASELNPLLAQFKQFHPANIFSPDGVSDSLNSPNVEDADADADVTVGDSSGEFGAENAGDVGPTPELEDVELEELDWSIDIGIQHNWFINDQLNVINQVFYDVSKVHSGNRIKSVLSWSIPPMVTSSELASWRFVVEAGLHYLDQETTQYYFGVDKRDTEDTRVYFETKAALNYHLALTAIRPISDNVNLLLFYRVEQLDNNLTKSPIVTDDNVVTYFAGITYDF